MDLKISFSRCRQTSKDMEEKIRLFEEQLNIKVCGQLFGIWKKNFIFQLKYFTFKWIKMFNSRLLGNSNCSKTILFTGKVVRSVLCVQIPSWILKCFLKDVDANLCQGSFAIFLEFLPTSAHQCPPVATTQDRPVLTAWSDFPAVFFRICNFDICHEIQLTNTNTKGWK